MPNATLTIAGKEADREANRLIGSKKDIDVRANFTDVTEVYRGVDVVVAPMVSGAGVKVKVIESLAMGKTVVTTQYGVMGTGLRHDEHLFVADVKDASAFAAHCITGLKQGARYLLMRKRGRNYVFNNHRTAAVMPVFENALRESLARIAGLTGEKKT